jgi:hypothetical protein
MSRSSGSKRSDLVAALQRVILAHLRAERLALLGEIEASGWAWCAQRSRRLTALDFALESVGVRLVSVSDEVWG